jgi:hypothetical protein
MGIAFKAVAHIGFEKLENWDSFAGRQLPAAGS